MVVEKLPEFTDAGLLPPGDYELSLEELAQSMLVVGPKDRTRYPNWDAAWRKRLVDNLSVMVHQLWRVGVARIFVDGSFAEDKERPNDIDGYFQCELSRLASGELERELNLLDPHKVWTWDPASRRAARGFAKKQLPMWHVYRVELYPRYGQPCGITDAQGHEMEFPSAFRRSRRDGMPRGIVRIGDKR